MIETIVTRHGQITLSKDIRQKLGINQCDRRDPTASRWGMPHSVTTFQIGVAASSGVSNPIWK